LAYSLLAFGTGYSSVLLAFYIEFWSTLAYTVKLTNAHHSNRHFNLLLLGAGFCGFIPYEITVLVK
jgi:hypothetical protein